MYILDAGSFGFGRARDAGPEMAGADRLVGCGSGPADRIGKGGRIMNFEDQERLVTIEQLAQLLSAVQVLGRKLGNESHGRAYDRVHELNEILHCARMQLNLIEAEAGAMPMVAAERRRAPRTSFDI